MLPVPQSLRSENAINELAMHLDGLRAQYHGTRFRSRLDIPEPQWRLYVDLATRLLHRLGPPVKDSDDPKLRQLDLALARCFEVVK